jgi:hypothetical protein
MKRLFVFLMLLALGLGMASAQELTTGTLEGVVQDDEGNPINDALVTAFGPQGMKTTTTDGQGRYTIRGLIPGEYKVRAEAPGYAAMIQSEVEVYINRRTQLPFTLNAGMTEEVTVISQAPIVDLKSTTTGETIKISDFAPYVPLGRNLVSVMAVSPGVTDGGTIGAQNQSISGSSGLENAYFVDGVNVTNSGFGALGSYSIVYGSLGTGVTYDFLEEVQVKTGGFEAEYGQAGGGVVNTVVKSGTNSFQLDFAWYQTPGGIEGTRGNRTDTPNWGNRTETTRQDIVLSAGGPFVKDKFFGFAAYNPVKTTENFTLTSGNPDEDYYLEDTNGDGLICDADGICFDPSTGTSGPSGGLEDDPFNYAIGKSVNNGRVPDEVERVRSIDNYAAKLSWFVTPNHKVEATGFGDPSDGDVGPQAPVTFLRNLSNPILVPDPASGATGLQYGGDQLSFKYQGVFTSNFFAELLVARKENEFGENGPGTEVRSFYDPAADVAYGGAGFYEGKVDETTQYSLKLTNVIGPVELRYGVQFDEMEFKDPSNRSGDPYTAYFPNLADVPVDADGDGNQDIDTDGEPVFGLGFPSATGCIDATTVVGNTNCYQPLGSSTGAAVDALNNQTEFNVTRTAMEPLDSVTKNEETNFYAQVSWDALSNLTVKAGLRWTQQELTGSGEFTLPVSTTDLTGTATGIGSTDYVPKTYKFDDEIAPRIGISWDILNDGKHKAYANFGQYFQRVPSDLAVRQFSNEFGIEDERFSDPGLTDPLIQNTCWFDTNGDGNGDTQLPCHTIDGVTGAEPGIILDGTQFDEGDPLHLGTDVQYVTSDATRLPMTQEWLVGYAWEVNDFTGFEVRYIQRELGEVMEDVQFASNEQIWNLFRGDRLFANYGSEVFEGHGVGSFGAYVLANVGGNVDNNLFPNPVRDYKSFEVVFNRRFKDGWMAYANYRYAQLDGNYEGSFRNDNGQSDPFITSLFDLPAASGQGGGNFIESETLAGQYTIGPLNTDRSHVLNAFVSKQFDFGLNLGVRGTFRTGQPRFPLFAHPTYRNAGEIPGQNPTYWYLVEVDGSTGVTGEGLLFDNDAGFSPDDPAPVQDYDLDGIADPGGIVTDGPRLFAYDVVKRDAFGRNPASVTFDIHGSYDISLRGGKSKLTLLLDIFNLFNENIALTFNNDVENRPGTPNDNYLKANLFATPRQWRLGIRFTY